MKKKIRVEIHRALGGCFDDQGKIRQEKEITGTSLKAEKGRSCYVSRIFTGHDPASGSAHQILKKVENGVGSGQEVAENSRAGWGWVGSGRVGSGRVGSGRVRRFSKITCRAVLTRPDPRAVNRPLKSPAILEKSYSQNTQANNETCFILRLFFPNKQLPAT